MKKTLLLFIGLSFLISCTNDDSPSVVDSDQNPVSYFPPNYIGTSGQLKKMKWTMGDGTPNSNWYYSYNGNKLIKKIVLSPDNLTTYNEYIYEYNNDLITKVFLSTQLLEQLTYDNQNRLIQRISSSNKDEYEYLNNGIRWKNFSLDSNSNYNLIGDNLISVDSYSQILSVNNYTNNNPVAVYEYDNKVSPMRNIIGFDKLLNNFNQDDAIYNNITKQIDPNSPINTKNIVYEYNSENKPTKVTYSDNSSTYLIVELEYYQ